MENMRSHPPQQKGHMISQQRQSKGQSPLLPTMLSMQLLSIVISCVMITCSGFQTPINRGSWTTAKGRVSIEAPSSMKMPTNVLQSSPIKRGAGQYPLMAAPRTSLASQDDIMHCCSGGSFSSTSTRNRHFPQRKTRTNNMMSIMMAKESNDVSNNESSNNPLVKVWLSFRKLLARFWALLLKPFQLLKSLLTKSKKDEDLVGAETEEDEGAKPEGVAITEVENIAAVEDSAGVLEVEQKKEEKMEEVAEVVAEAPSSPAKEEVSSSETATTTAAETLPTSSASGPRAATTANVDLSGNWTLIVDDSFTSQYEDYLRKLGQPMLVRTVALTVIGSTKEETIQSKDGKHLFIRGMNVRGSWERTLEASEQLVDENDIDVATGEKKHAVDGHELKPMTTADGEDVEVASWWENNGKVHHSWVVGGKKYGGGDFENKRYLTDNGNILVCESTFHPRKDGENGGEGLRDEEEKASVTWRFLREGAIYGDAAVEFPNIFDVLKKDEKDLEPKKDTKGSGLVVGDIMDNVGITSDEEAANEFLPTSDKTTNAVNLSDVVEEQIERESWVPPSGDRWAIAAPGVDLSGKWKLIITEQFKKDYEEFLRSLGQPLIVRGAAVVLIGNTREETKQSDNGRSLHIKGVNAKGIWERTLTSSGSDFDKPMKPDPKDGSYNHVRVPIVTADSERVVAESWWEKDGTVHVSWTYGVKRYGGGSFESKRYLEEDGDVYVCESIFHPNDKDREASFLKWKFLREGAAFMLTDKS